ETNTNKQSAFVTAVNEMPSIPVKPVWIDYNKDLQKLKVGPAEMLYVQNKDNSIFRMRYRFDMGTFNERKLGMAAQYLSFLGTPQKSAEQITKDFYKIACSFSVSASGDYTTVTIEGLQENFNKATVLFEDLLKNCKADEEALSLLKARNIKARTDAKLNKGMIMNGLTMYARYGASNPMNYVLSDDELNALSSGELVSLLHGLNNYSHKILYYGPQPAASLSASLQKMHKMPVSFKILPQKKVFTWAKQTKNQVLFSDYDMVQAETRWIRNDEKYNPQDEMMADVFNNYFGGGMGAIVFQTIRESKALAYSTFAQYVTPSKKEDPFFTIAYVGSQADKFNDAVAAMNELLNDLPEIKSNFEFAKDGIKKDIQTERIVQDGIIFNYLQAQDKGLKEDIRKQIYENVDKVTFNQVKEFHDKYLSHKPYTYAIVASKDKMKMEDLKKIGEVKTLSLEELFGY
ncbi:MAG: insulinase family protein, partial [Ginsengibacter sp.]